MNPPPTVSFPAPRLRPPPRPGRRHPPGAATLVAALLATAPAVSRAAILEFELSGTVTSIATWDFVVEDGIFIPAPGDPFTATFRFDTDAALSAGGVGSATYGAALLDIVLTLPDSFLVVSADTAPVFQENDDLIFGQGETDVWLADLFDGTGLTVTALPSSDTGLPPYDFLTTDALSEFALRREDTALPDIFTALSLPLTRPDDPAWPGAMTFVLAWEADVFTGDRQVVRGTVDTVRLVPEPASAPAALGLAALASLALGRRRRMRS